MTYKNTKTILFASLIVAMVLPFSGMQSANALHNGDEHGIYQYEDRQQRLVNMLEVIEYRIDNARTDEIKQSFESVKQRILGKLLESSLLQNGATEMVDPVLSEPGLFESNFDIEGIHLGCDGVTESWSYQGILENGQAIIYIEQNFPDRLTMGMSPNCEDLLWQSYIQLNMQPAFLGVGCQGNLETSPTSDYTVDCQTEMSGLWIVGITTSYGELSETKYTYVDV